MHLLSGLADLTADAVLADAELIRGLEREAGATKLIRATEWADLHPAENDDPDGAWEPEMTPSLPRVAWDSPAEFAAAFGLTTDAGTELIRESLELRHRLPRVWSRVLAGQVEGWRARRIAEYTVLHPDDVARAIDIVVAPIAHKVGVITLDRLLTETLIRLYPDQVAAQSKHRLDRRHVTLFDQVSHEGVATIHIGADLKDAVDFNTTITQIAAALANDPDCPESLDIRRSMAIGILADPEQATALLNQAKPDSGAADDRAPAAKAPGRGLAKLRKQIQLHVHMSEAAVAGISPVGRIESGSQVVLADLIRDWCGRTDTHLTVLPVIDLADHMSTDSYQAPDRLERQTELKHPTCQFPWCTRPARRCDKDHCIPFDDGGRTCSCNLVPLCRRHHRLKTLTLWRYHVVEPGVFIWRAPHGRQYLRDPSGTTDIGPAPDKRNPAGDLSPPWDGCFHSAAS